MSPTVDGDHTASAYSEGLLDLDQNTRTRGNDKKLKKKYSKLNIRKFSFTNRIVDIWNSLPNEHEG
jgi:hypothetical protein